MHNREALALVWRILETYHDAMCDSDGSLTDQSAIDEWDNITTAMAVIEERLVDARP
jgi:hypothetical protein